MRHSPSWKSKSPSAGRAIPCSSWNPKVHYHVHNSTSPVPILGGNADHAYPKDLFKIHLILSSHLRLGLPSISFPEVSLPQPRIHRFSPPYVLHVLTISLLLIWSPGYVASRTDQKASRCAVSSSFLSLRPPQVFLSNHFQKQQKSTVASTCANALTLIKLPIMPTEFRKIPTISRNYPPEYMANDLCSWSLVSALRGKKLIFNCPRPTTKSHASSF